MGPFDAPVSLSEALFSGVQRRVLRLLFGEPGSAFHHNEILKLTGSGKGGLRRELQRLVGSGLVLVNNVGNQKRYQANPDSPIFSELRAIVQKTFGLSDELRDALRAIADRIKLAFVYGSFAKRTDTAASDIDLLVVSDSLSYQDLLAALAETEARLKRKVNPTLYTAADFARRRAEGNSFIVRVLEQPKLLLIGDPNEFGEPRKPGEDRQTEGRGSGAGGV
jgi:predicted nucleotidyltransferase